VRCVTVVFTLLVTVYAVNSTASIFKMVENPTITLVTAFVPLVLDCSGSVRPTRGAGGDFLRLVGMAGIARLRTRGPLCPGSVRGPLASLAGMIAVSLAPQKMGGRRHMEPEHAYLHHQAPAETYHVAEGPHLTRARRATLKGDLPCRSANRMDP